MLKIQTYFEKLPAHYRESFDKRLDKKIAILQKFLNHYPDDFDLKVNAEQIRTSEFKVEFRFFYPDRTFSLEKYGKTPLQTLEIAFTSLKENITQQLEATRKEHSSLSRSDRSALLNASLDQVNTYVEKQNKDEFIQTLLPLLSDLKAFIKRRIRLAQIAGQVEPGQMTVNDILNEVILIAFESFLQKPEDKTFEHWLFNLANHLLTKRLHEERFENENWQSWEELFDINDKDLDSRLKVDYDNEIKHEVHFSDEIPLETELVELSENYYQPDFLGTDKVPKGNNHIMAKKVLTILSQMPHRDRNVFDLYVFERFNENEIAKITGIDYKQVKAIIKDVKENLKKNLNKKR